MHRRQDYVTAQKRTDWPRRDRHLAWRASELRDRARPRHLRRELPEPRRGGWRWLVVVLFISPPFSLAGDALWRMYTGQDAQDRVAPTVSVTAALKDLPKESPKPAEASGAGLNSATGATAMLRGIVIPAVARTQPASADSHVPVDIEHVLYEGPLPMAASWAVPAETSLFPSSGYGDARSLELAGGHSHRPPIQTDSGEASGRAADDGGVESATKEAEATGGSGGTAAPIRLEPATIEGEGRITEPAVVAFGEQSSNGGTPRSRITSFIEPGEESDAAIVLEIRMAQPVRQSVAVLYATVDGTAKAGEDYEPRNGALIFAPGETVVTLRTPILDDDRAEDDESFEFFLTVDPNTAELDSQHIVATIRDDDTTVADAQSSVTMPHQERQRAETTLQALTSTVRTDEPATASSGMVRQSTAAQSLGPPALDGIPAVLDTVKRNAEGGGYRVQLAALRSEASARIVWERLQSDLGVMLDGWQPILERAETQDGTLYRLQLGLFGAREEADRFCAQLKEHATDCFVVNR